MKMKKKKYRTVRVSMDTYEKLSIIMGDEMRRRKKYVPYDKVVDMICDLYFAGKSHAKDEEKR